VPKRTRVEILIDILETLAHDPTNPTRLATLVNMPYDRLKPIMMELEAKGIVKRTRGSRSSIFELTPKGMELLRELRRLKKVLQDFGLSLRD
jgi:predicted transcriptional regulator